MLRNLIKTGISGALYRTGLCRLQPSLKGSSKMALVLGYHRVAAKCPSPEQNQIASMFISCHMFEQHLDWLGRRFRFVSLDELGSLLEQDGELRRPVAAITFDDGYSDVYHLGFPILNRKGIPAAIFVITDNIGTSQVLLHDRLYNLLSQAFARWPSYPNPLPSLLADAGLSHSQVRALIPMAKDPFTTTRALLESLSQDGLYGVKEALEDEVRSQHEDAYDMGPLTWEMLSEMQRGGFTIGSHTRSHVVLTHENRPRIEHEIATSRQQLETALGIPIRHFAYPDGRFQEETVRAVAAAGYRYAYTICQHRNSDYPLLTIPRRVLWENSCMDVRGVFSPSIMSCQVHGFFDLVNTCTQHHTWQALPENIPADRTELELVS